jgi:hypothetical protein
MAKKSNLEPDEPQRNAYLPEWARVLLMHWPRTEWLTPEADYRLAMRTMERAMRKVPDENELEDVVDWMAGPESSQKFAPSLREFMIAVYTRRKAGRQEAQGYEPGENVVADTKAAMVRVKDWRERWNILCQGSFYGGIERDLDSDETLAVDSWARVHWGSEWDKHTMAIKQAMGRGIREVVERLWPNAKPSAHNRKGITR